MPQMTNLTGTPIDLGDVPLNFKCHVSDNSGVSSDHGSTGTEFHPVRRNILQQHIG